MGVLEREKDREKESVRRGEERGMEQFTNENGDYVKPQFCCIEKVRMQTPKHWFGPKNRKCFFFFTFLNAHCVLYCIV